MTQMTGSVNLNGGGDGGGYIPSTKKSRQATKNAGEEETAPRTATSDGDGGRQFHRSDVQEIFLISLQEPFKSALATLMGLLEQVNNIPQEVRIAIVAGPLGYMSHLRAARPTPFVPTPSLLKPLVR